MVDPLGPLGSVLLHGGGPVGTSGDVHWSFVAASVAVVGVVGGLLYWYYGNRVQDERRVEKR